MTTIIVLFLVFKEISVLFSSVVVPVYIPSNSVQRVPFPPHLCQHLSFAAPYTFFSLWCKMLVSKFKLQGLYLLVLNPKTAKPLLLNSEYVGALGGKKRSRIWKMGFWASRRKRLFNRKLWCGISWIKRSYRNSLWITNIYWHI